MIVKKFIFEERKESRAQLLELEQYQNSQIDLVASTFGSKIQEIVAQTIISQPFNHFPSK